MEELNTRLIRPYESRLRCLFIAFLVACFVMSVTYLFGGFSNHLPTPIWLRVLYFPVVIFLILFFSGRFVVPVGYVAILYRLGTPQYNRIHTEGLHWSFYPFEALHLHPNQKFINTDEYRLEDVACYNKAFMTINAKVQWRLVDPFKQIGQDPIQLGHAYHNCIFDTISNYINDHKTTNAEIFNIKYTIEKVVLSELSLLVKPWGEVIDGVSLRLSPADTEF
jgi:energy-coupling factor transporter transmembrane protein EcfT